MSGQERGTGLRALRRRKRIYKRKRFPKDREWIERRGRKRKEATKADIKRALHKYIGEAISHIDVYNRIDIVPARCEHLQKAIEFLEKALEIRPGQHLLRKQHDTCIEELKLILDGQGGSRIEVLLQETIK